MYRFTVDFFGSDFQAFYITDKAEALTAIKRLMEYDTTLAIDTETEALPEFRHVEKAALSPHLAKIRLMQVFNGKSSVIFDLKKIANDSIFIALLETKKFIAHHAPFDFKFFYSLGALKIDIGCTLIAAKLVNHAATAVDFKMTLDALTEGFLGKELPKHVQTSDWSVSMLTHEQLVYAALDPIAVWYVAEKLSKGIAKYGLQKIYDLNRAAIPAIAKMELNGIAIDKEKHIKLVDRWRAELYAAKKELTELTGLPDITNHKIAKWLEEKLDKDVLTFWPRTDLGKLKTDANTLSEFSHLEIVTPFSKFQKLEKLTTSFGMNLLQKLNPKTGRLHTSFNICGARTGRLSSSEPNLQTAPRDKEFRELFVPSRRNFKFICGDFGQIEVRVVAELSQDKELLSVFNKGEDVYEATAQKMIGQKLSHFPYDKRKILRQSAKALVLGLLYGLGAKKYAHYANKNYGLKLTQAQGEESVTRFREIYPTLYSWQQSQGNLCTKKLFATTVTGKRRRLQEDYAYTAGLNQPVQGTSAEIMLSALIRANKTIRLVNCVHDEILGETFDIETIHVNAKRLESSMIEGALNILPNLPTKNLVEAKIGDSWGACK